jgi:hypothetical protein
VFRYSEASGVPVIELDRPWLKQWFVMIALGKCKLLHGLLWEPVMARVVLGGHLVRMRNW